MLTPPKIILILSTLRSFLVHFLLVKTFSTRLINQSLAHTVIRFMRAQKDEKSQLTRNAN